jgi:hypothetical protein
MHPALLSGMTTLMRLSVALLSILTCYGCGADDQTPGPADAFVGAWQGSGKGYRYSGENGEYNWSFDSKATVTRVSPSAVTVASDALAGFCKPVYDVGDDGVGALRSDTGSQISCSSGSLILKGDSLSLALAGTENHLVYYETWSVDLALTRMP